MGRLAVVWSPVRLLRLLELLLPMLFLALVLGRTGSPRVALLDGSAVLRGSPFLVVSFGCS